MTKFLRAAGRLALFAAIGIGPAQAQTPFYQGKTISLIINFTAGGPTDTEGRIVGRHLAKHVAGNPTIVVRNMGGAGGAIGANYMGQVSLPDGLTLGYFSGMAAAAALDDASLKVDLTKFGFVAAGQGISVAYARTDLGGGIKTPADILTKHDFWVGGLSADSDKDVRIRMQMDLLGIPYHYLTGYPGSAEARLALQRNEVQVYVESMPTYRSAIEPGLVKEGQAIPLWYDINAEAGAVANSPDTAGIPAQPFEEFYKSVKGPPPASEKLAAFRLANAIGTAFQRLILTPPNTPPEATLALRKGMAELGADAEFADDAMKTIRFIPRYSATEKAETSYRESLHPDPKTKAFIREYIEEGKALVKK